MFDVVFADSYQHVLISITKIRTFLAQFYSQYEQFLLQSRSQFLLGDKYLNSSFGIALVSLNKFRISLPIVVLTDPLHDKLAMSVFSPLAFAQRYSIGFVLGKNSAPEVRLLFDDEGIT